jgi:hypothetical protein
MWSKVVRKGEKWWAMSTGKYISKLDALMVASMLLSLDPKIAGNCPK